MAGVEDEYFIKFRRRICHGELARWRNSRVEEGGSDEHRHLDAGSSARRIEQAQVIEHASMFFW